MIPIAGTILSGILLPNEHLTVSIILALILVAFGIGSVNHWNKPKKSGGMLDEE